MMTSNTANKGRPLNPKTAPIHQRIFETVRRAFTEFLKLPIIIVIGFLVLAACTWFLDHADVVWLHRLRAPIREHFFRDGGATSALLATIAGSIITVTSITFSLLLLAVQQAASALTHQVYDQFLRRRINQFYFGFFVGLAVYTLVTLASVNQPYNPVFGAAVALALTIIALMMMILLLYTTINQMRPGVVIDSIHDRILIARERQWAWLEKTRHFAKEPGVVKNIIRAERHGYVVRIDVDAIGTAVADLPDDVEIVLHVSIGTYVAFQDILAEIRSTLAFDSAKASAAVLAAIHVEQQRDLDRDPTYGIEQLADIGWTSISTAKSNPAPGLLVIHSLRDLIARWSSEDSGDEPQTTLPVIYHDDTFAKLLDTFEVLTVVASESMQPQTAAALMQTFAIMFDRLPVARQQRAEDLIRRSLSALGEHVLTSELEAALSRLAAVMEASGRDETANAIREAQETLGATVGKLASRSTRVTGG